MFGLIKWLVIFLVLGALWYCASFFLSMNSNEIRQVKKDAIEAIDTGDAKALTGPLSDKLKEDLLNKKASLYQRLRQKLKGAVNGLIDGED